MQRNLKYARKAREICTYLNLLHNMQIYAQKKCYRTLGKLLIDGEL